MQHTGFRAHLAAEDSVLDLTSAIEHIRPFGNYTLEYFSYVGKAFNRVRASIAVSSLRAIGLQGRIVRFLAAYLGSEPSHSRWG